jgi:hypothetical protein
MSRDPLSNPYLMNKLVKAQEELASGVKPGSVPHPRRVLKEAAKAGEYSKAENWTARFNDGKKTTKPSHPRRRKRRKPVTDSQLAGVALPPSGSAIDTAGGETDAERGLHPGKEEKISVVFCETCHGQGFIVVCWDDLCAHSDHCMHGDGEAICPDCHDDTRWP